MKILVAIALLLFTLPVFAADDPRIAEGIALHDAGKYDEAIAKYKAVLADDPDSLLATYELAFAYHAKGDVAQCRAVLEPVVDRKDRLQPLILAVYGNCLDQSGDGGGAVAAYRKGLKIAPNDTQLLYNLALALAAQNKNAEARELLKKELALRPGHGSGHYLLAQLFEAEGFRVPALLEYLRLLAVEFGTPRRKDAAQKMVALLNLGVEKTVEGANITIDPDSRKEEGDFGGYEMMLAIASAGRFTEDKEGLTEFEKVRSQLASSLMMLIEAPPKGRSYTVRQNVPFFQELEKKKLIDVFAGIALSPLGLDGAQAWAKDNEKAISQYAQFVDGLPK